MISIADVIFSPKNVSKERVLGTRHFSSEGKTFLLSLKY